MGEPEGFEPFSMDNDFEGGQWIGGEFYYESQKKRRKMTKEDMIYGIFNEGDSDEDDDFGGGGLGYIGKKKKGKETNLAMGAAMRFVSSGILTEQKADGEEEEAAEREEEAELPLDEREEMALEEERGHAGLQYRQHWQKNKRKPTAEVPSSFGKQAKPSSGKKKVTFDTGTDTGAKELGQWEMYTKSIGSKLLAKMGYKGGGLGKDGTGMAKPIEVKVRPKNLGLGAGGFDRRSEEELEEERKRACTSTAKTATAKVVKIPDAPPQVQEKVRGGRRECVDELTCPQGWKKDRKQKPKVVYKTAEEIVREATPQKQVIIDMTTAQPRVLTSLDQAIAPEAALKKAVYMPELQYNIRTLVDLLEINLQNLDRKHKNEKEAIERLTREARRLEALAKAESEQRERLRAMNEILSRVRQRIAASQMTPEALAKNFELLQKDYKEEYYVFNLPALALALALPLMRTHLDAWDPASNPSGPVPLLQTWQNVLRPEGDGPKDVQAEIQEPYFRLCYELLLPRLRSFISSRWDPRNADPVIRLFEAFDGVLPPRIQRNLLEYSVLPKLRAAVEAWNPRTDPVPVHSWLHPFLPLLGDQLEPLYIPIRHKLARALQEWHPSDASAYGVLAPWKEVWDSGSMERLLVACIVPKLIGALRQLVINPLQQDPRPFQWVTAWADLLPAHHLAQMFESEFFPKWLVTLHAWLMGRPNFEEVMRWYLGWKSLLPAGLESHPRVEYYLNHALNLMNRAVSGQPLGPILPVPGQSELPPLPEEQPPPPPPPPPPPRPPPPPSEPRPPPPPPVDISLREVVEKIAEEHGLLFMPNPRRHHPGGKQVHSFGKVDVVLDRDVLYALKAGQWVPVSVEELLDMARKM